MSVPLISIGLPVYNGQRYLHAALDDLLAQRLADFELIIADNASTDDTPAICADYAARDARIRVIRHPTNIGAAPNFNSILPHVRGRYFRWHAHDDRCDPRHLEQCAAVLDADPEVVLAYPQTMKIDGDGAEIELDPFVLLADVPSPSERFAETLRGHGCYEVFGLMRTDALRNTRLIGNYAHGDGVLLSELALRGRFREVSAPLFLSRTHAGHSMTMVMDYHAYAAWFDPKNKGRLVFPCWRILREYIRAVNRAPIGARERLRCYRAIRDWCVQWRGRLRGDLTFAVRRLLRLRPKPRRQDSQPPAEQAAAAGDLATEARESR